MNATFRRYVRLLDAKVDDLLAARPHKYAELPRGSVPQSGIYLFSEGKRHFYVGRSNRIRARLRSHCRDSSRHNAASFAFLLAREWTIKDKTGYTRRSRDALSADRTFAAAFTKAKAYLRTLDIRFVEEQDQVGQALLEIYAAVRLDTPYNDFRTH